MPSFKLQPGTSKSQSRFQSLHVVAVVLLILTSGALLHVQAQCTAPAGAEVICSPGSGATVTSPVHIVGASNLSPAATTTLIYIDYVKVFTASGPSVDTTLTIATGTHHLTVQSYNGTWTKASEFFTVSSTAGVGVSISPTSANLSVNATQQFTATVSGSSNTSVTWSVDGVVGGNSTTGTISTSGLYTAPAMAGSHTVTATSVADSTKSANASVTVTSTSAVSVSISPTSATLAPNATQQFTATVSGANDTSVTWSVDGVAGGNSTTGTISASGLYTAPGAAGSHTVTATSVADSTKSANASVTVMSSSGCVATTDRTVNICSPLPNSTNTSPVQFTAAALDNEHSVTAMILYVDSVNSFKSSGAQLSVSLSLANGNHNIVIRAWDTSGFFFSSSETITVSSTGGTVSVSVSPTSATLAVNATQQFTANVAGSSNTSVTWSVDGVAGGNSTIGTISTSGLYTAPGTAGSHTIMATSVADSSKSASANVTVTSGTTSCNAPAGGEIICSPASGATVASPVHVVGASNLSPAATTTLVYIDNVKVFTANGPSVDTMLTVADGTHFLVVQSYNGAWVKASENITVSSGGGGGGGGNPPGNVSVLTSKNDNARTGANPNETVLTPTSVASAQFQKRGSWALDGSMQAQPLYVPGVQINGTTFNVLYVATENDSVYALNADAPGSAPLWQRSFLGNGVTIGTGYTGGRTSIGPNVGITGTPVIDVSSNRLYVLPRTTENGANVYHMHAIDIRNGADVVPPVLVQASVRGTGDGSDGAGNLPFDGNTQNQRPGLLLSNGVVYGAFASFSDQTPYNGWVMAFDANTLQILNAYAVTPNGDGGGIWMAGTGLSADTSGAVYFTSGNGMPNATALFNPPTDLPNSVLKLAFNGSSFSLADYFAPFNDKCLSADDLDVGSAGVLILPDGLAGQNMMVTASKEGRIYLIDRNSMGNFHSGSDQVIQEILINPQGACGSSTFNASSPWRIYGAPSYWNGNVYLGSAFGPLRQYSITSGTLQQVALGTFTYSASGQNGRGPIPVISANGASGGVVWTSWRDLSGNGWLHAYDASNINHLLFSSNYGSGTVFTVPTVANGRVYVTGGTVVYAYGTQ